MDTSDKSGSVHLRKQCAVVIRKPKLRVFDEYEALIQYVINNPNATSTDWTTARKTYFQEQLERFRNIIFTKHDLNSDQTKLLLDPGDDSDFWYIVATGYLTIKNDDMVNSIEGNSIALQYQNPLKSVSTQMTDTIGNFSISADTNNSVVSVSVEQSTETAWTANVVLDNTNDIYVMQNQPRSDGTPSYTFQEGDCIIDANDEVDIYLTDWDSKLRQVFKGYVNTASPTDNGVQKRIMLQCEDCTKHLSTSRTNANPGLDPKEALADDITPFTQSYATLKPEDVITITLGRVYCGVLTDFDFIKANISYLNTKGKTPTQIQSNIKTLKENLVSTIRSSKYTTVQRDVNGQINRILGYEYVEGIKRLKFVIDGINQPAWAIEFNNGGWDYKVSQWKSNDQVISEIVDKVFYEFYADTNGVIQIRPTNLSLPKYLNSNTAGYDTYNIVQKNYIITKDKEIYVHDFTGPVFNDRMIFTYITISGLYDPLGIGNPMMRRVVSGPYKWIKMFGSRMAPPETKLGCVSQPQMESYGQARLRRHNADAWTASMNIEGNSQISAGKPMFIERWQSVFYIPTITHSFTAGEDYTTTINLNNRRKPIDFIGVGNDIAKTLLRDLNSLMNRDEISAQELADVYNNRGTLQWGRIIYPLVDTVNTGVGLIQKILGTTIIQTATTAYDIIWEHIPTIFDPGKLQNNDASISILNRKIMDAWQNWQSSLASGESASTIDAYRQKYIDLMDQAPGILNGNYNDFDNEMDTDLRISG